jgi:ribonuclease HII
MNIFEKQNIDYQDYQLIAGVDEAGRGPLAGPVVIAAVILKKDAFHQTLNDSKQLTEKKRELLYDWIIDNSLAYVIKSISAKQIDEMNILQATLYGMKLCLEELDLKPDLALIDGNKTPTNLKIPAHAIIKGDATYACIAAASILAKVTRDRIMLELDKLYPQYDFKTHKGYPTKKHIQRLTKHGISLEHRLSYDPVKKIYHKDTLF